MTFDPSTATLTEAKDWLRAQVNDGAHCPCCTQFAKVYKRQVTSTSAAALIRMWRAAGHDFAHLPTVLRRKQADECKMTYWGLIEEEITLRPDGGRAGWWRVTKSGLDWIEGTITIPRYAHIFDGRCLKLEGEPRTIHDALGTRFNYRELMDS